MWSVPRRSSTCSMVCGVFPTSYSVGHSFVVIRTSSRGEGATRVRAMAALTPRSFR